MSKDKNKESETPRLRRASRYQKAQDRRAQQSRADNRFYGAMFSLMGTLALLVVLVGAVMLNGGNVDVSGMGDLAQPWLGPLSKLEAIGIGFVGLIALAVWLRMRKR